MARIFVAVRAVAVEGDRFGQWIDVDESDAMRRRMAEAQRGQPQAGARGWCVLAYDDLPDFGLHPDIEELLAYLDAVDDYGEPFEKLWASRRFASVLYAADVFADSYQGTYSDVGAWARHYLALIGRLSKVGPGFDFDGYGRETAAKGDLQFIAAEDGGIPVFWKN